MKSSSFARSIELAKLAARVGLKELTSRDLKSRLNQAVLIANSLSNLKGAAMKAGQLLSLDLDNYFPPEAIEVLSQLQNAAVAHPYAEIEAVLRAELGLLEFERLQDIASVPIGIASIGQVHRAKYKGQDIVLKVQYPGVADSIDSDLKILKTIAVSFCQLSGRKMDLEPLFNEFGEVLRQEVEYGKEALLQMEYRQNLNALTPSGKFHFRAPEVIETLSTQKVLAMGFEKGVSLRSWIATKPSKEQRLAMGGAILDLYFHEFFEWGLVQTDPNLGNFLVDASGESLSLCLLDFGATKRYPRDFIQNYIRLLDLSAANQLKELNEHAIEFGLIDKRESALAFELFHKMLSVAIKPFFAKQMGAKYFDFSDRNHALDSQNAAKDLARELVYSPPPYSIIFLHRKLAGVYSILKSLELQLDVSAYWQMMKDLSARKNK